jgi:hypothetical protein
MREFGVDSVKEVGTVSLPRLNSPKIKSLNFFIKMLLLE